MTVTVIAQIALRQDCAEDLAEYFRVTTPLLKQAGARIVRRFNLTESVVGQSSVMAVVVVEYPDHHAVSQMFESAEYCAIKEVRDKAFSHYQISICAVDEPIPETT